jgi:signal transduction histidine kinase
MPVSLTTISKNLQDILSTTEAMHSGRLGKFEKDALNFAKVIQRNARELRAQQVTEASLSDLSKNSHALRQLLTGIVGYCALLNSPKLSNHSVLSAPQLEAVRTMNDKAREVQWWLDGLILFANQITGALDYRSFDAGMLNLGGYLRSQADHYICRRYVTDINIPESLPNVYANDTQAKLMLRALFSVILQLADEPQIQVDAYTVRQHVRARVTVQNKGYDLSRLMALVDATPMGIGDQATGTLHMPADRLEKNNLLNLSVYVLTEATAKQSGRIKLQRDDRRLCFTLTMPTVVPTATL